MSAFDAVFHAVAGAFNYDGFGMMKKSIEDGGGNSAIAVEDSRPLFEGFVGGKDDGAAFVTLANDLEEKVGSALVNGEVTDLVEHENRG